MVAFSRFDRTKLINKADAIRAAVDNKKLHDDSYHDAVMQLLVQLTG